MIKMNEMFTCNPLRHCQRTHGYGGTVVEVQRPALSPVVFRVTVLQEKGANSICVKIYEQKLMIKECTKAPAEDSKHKSLISLKPSTHCMILAIL